MGLDELANGGFEGFGGFEGESSLGKKLGFVVAFFGD